MAGLNGGDKKRKKTLYHLGSIAMISGVAVAIQRKARRERVELLPWEQNYEFFGGHGASEVVYRPIVRRILLAIFHR